MKHITLELFAGSLLLSTLLFSGCGGTVVKEDSLNTHTPHNLQKALRTTSDKETDWTWYVHTQAQFTIISKSDTIFELALKSTFSQGIPDEVEHLQYFVDSDNDANTGFSYGQDSWEISGADYLIEDGDLYKSLSDSEWKWEYIGTFSHYTRTKIDEQKSIISMSSDDQLITSIIDENKLNQINISIEPFNENWAGTYSTISTQNVPLDIITKPPENTNN